MGSPRSGLYFQPAPPLVSKIYKIQINFKNYNGHPDTNTSPFTSNTQNTDTGILLIQIQIHKHNNNTNSQQYKIHPLKRRNTSEGTRYRVKVHAIDEKYLPKILSTTTVMGKC